MTPLGDENELARFQFLHDRRMTLFNTRRDHEWKIFFGMIGLFLAADAVLIAYGVSIVGLSRWIWAGAIGVLTACCIRWLLALQSRNSLDRNALNTINNVVCRSLSLDEKSPIWEHAVDGRWGWWTLLPQLVSLLVVASLSAFLPHLGIIATCKHS
jgi:hypothetical protein